MESRLASLAAFCAHQLPLAEVRFGDEELMDLYNAYRRYHCEPGKTFEIALAKTPLAGLCAEGQDGPAHAAVLRGESVLSTPGEKLVRKFVLADSASRGEDRGGSIESQIITAIVAVVSSHAKAELQTYAIDLIKDRACTGQRRYWFQQTCTFVETGNDELPATFGAGLRVALVTDLQALAPRAVTQVSAGTKGDAVQLVALLFTSAIDLLRQQADLATVAQEMTRLAGSVFSCTSAADVRCAAVRRALRFGGAAIDAVLRGNGTLPPPLADELQRIAAANGVVLPPGEPQTLLALIADARDHGRRFKAADREHRVNEVKGLVDAIVAVVDDVLALGDASIRMPDGLGDLMDSIARGRVLPLLTKIVTVVRSLPEIGPRLDGTVLRLLSFAGELAEAKDADQAKAVIESVVAPVGSYRMKRRQVMFSVGGYLGVTAGSERLSSSVLAADTTAQSKFIAPVGYLGLDLSLPLSNPVVPHAGLLLSVIDVGSLLSYRTSTDSASTAMSTADVSQVSNIGFAQVFSPGMFARVGLGASPIVLGQVSHSCRALGTSPIMPGWTWTPRRSGGRCSPRSTLRCSPSTFNRVSFRMPSIW